MAKQAPEIIAFHLGTDVESVKEGRYQRTVNPAVYVYGEDFYCAPHSESETSERHAMGIEW